MIRAIVLPTRQMGWPTFGCNQQDLGEPVNGLSTASLPAWFPKVAGGASCKYGTSKSTLLFFIQIAVDGESVRRRFSAPHQFAANAQEQIALRRMCRNEQAYL